MVKYKQSGFSLIEVVFSFAIIVIVYIGAVQSFPSGLAINQTSSNVSQAGFLAEAKVEDLIATGYYNISTGVIEPKARLSDDPASPLYDFWRQTGVSFIDGSLNVGLTDSGLKKINTQVFYFDTVVRKQKVFEINTFIARD